MHYGNYSLLTAKLLSSTLTLFDCLLFYVSQVDQDIHIQDSAVLQY